MAIVAAEGPERAAAAAASVIVQYDVLDPLTDLEEAERLGEVFRTVKIRQGNQAARGEVVVEAYYETAMQDQAPLGPESGLAISDAAGGVDLHISTQWIHSDHAQIVEVLDLRPDQVGVPLAGIGGAFGAREDVSLQIHLCALARHTGRPVKMVHNRAESFAGHVKRHPSPMWYRHEADSDGRLVRVVAAIRDATGLALNRTPRPTGRHRARLIARLPVLGD